LDFFKKDLFSDYIPKWQKASLEAVCDVRDVLKNYFPDAVSFDEDPRQVGALEINSSNFKISVNNKKFLLKRWDQSAQLEMVENQLALLNWLKDKKVPVAVPVLSLENKNFSLLNNRIWVLFEFLGGEYFKGTKPQLVSVAKSIGRLSRELKSIPLNIKISNGPQQLLPADREILRLYSQNKSKWEEILGTEHALVLRQNLDHVVETWDQVEIGKAFGGRPQAIHYDLHPHNVLMSESDVAGILDFDACAVLEPGVALGFSVMKLVRQAVAFDGIQSQAAELGNLFIAELIKEDSQVESFAQHFNSLAKSEVLRRIVLILKLNLEKSDKRWNHVLPVQIDHLYECDLIFGGSL
jgi:aminoglycoside phosphotransferase (APT) family kinase protein